MKLNSLSCLMLMFAFVFSPGCLEQQGDNPGWECWGTEDELGWDVHENATTDGTDDELLRVMLDDQCHPPGELEWVFTSHPDCGERSCVSIGITDWEDVTHQCTMEADAPCQIIEDNPDGVWKHGEWVTLVENGVDILSEGEDDSDALEDKFWPYGPVGYGFVSNS